MPSWQARLFNAISKATMKPMMRYGSVDMIRYLAPKFASLKIGRDTLGDKFELEEIITDQYHGEFLHLKGSKSKKVILYFPGGGFITRVPVYQRNYIAGVCRLADAHALIVHYRLAPETPYPGGLEDCLAAYHDLLDRGHKAENIVITGESAGGGLVLSTLLGLRDEGTPLPDRAIILSPLADLTFSGESRLENAEDDPMLPNVRHSGMHQLYMGDYVPNDRFLSPVFADFDGLPPMLGIVGSTEILRDDTVKAYHQAEKAGVPFYLEIWKKMPHVFPLISVLPESKLAIARMARFINHLPLAPLPEKLEFRSVNWAKLAA